MNWTIDQQKIIQARNSNLLVSAAAGSGKTAVLVERIIEMISDPDKPINIDELLVVTFTKAAAAQMRDKIAAAIEKMIQKEPENEHYLKQMNLIHQANILTIDSFCYQVVKEHFYVLGIDPGIRIGDTGEIGLMREEVLEKVMESFYEKNTDFAAFSDAFSADKNDEKIEDYILKIYDVCSSYPRPEEWTRQAREEVQAYTEKTFHARLVVKDYFAQIHYMAEGIREKILSALEKVRSIDGPIYMEKAFLSDIELVDDIISAKTYGHFSELTGWKFANIGRGKKGTYDEDLADRLKKIRDGYKKEIKELLSAFEIPLDDMLEKMKKQAPMLLALLDCVDTFREEFQKEKLAKNRLEFSDVEHFALQVLCEGYDEDGLPVPSRIGEEMSEQFQEILIDEYQDSNYLQEAILNCVSTISKGRYNVFMVGDVKQSIYSFRMARPDLFMEKYHTYPAMEGGTCRKLLLKNNFRSRANVLEGINYLFYQIMGADLGGIAYTEDEALVPGREFPDGPDDSVELLMGESKNFVYADADAAEECGEQEENLDEELQDIGKMELEATMVASRIEELMGKNVQTPLQIVDDSTGVLRDVTYQDMVILFRAPSSFQHVFYEMLMARGIPVQVQNEKGYFDTVEIRLVLSILKILDNPYQDVELAAVLRSYFGGCGNDELAAMILIKRTLEKQMGQRFSLYDLLQLLLWYDRKEDGVSSYVAVTRENVSEALGVCDPEWICRMPEVLRGCGKVIRLLERLQKTQHYAGITKVLTQIYREEGYYYYVESMPEGRKRAANLDLLLQESVKCGKDGFCSVFDFLRYVDKIQKKAISLGGDPSVESHENAVRIMSIHKSKGLEFPVVFLAGMGKNFNLMDTKEPLIVHSDYYLGAKYRDPQKRCGNDTFVRKAMTARMHTQSIAEELRIFYVGLTRAKEKLIMTGVTTDIPALIRRYEHIAKRKEEALTFSNVHTARNYLDFVVMSMMRNDAFDQAMCCVRKRMDQKREAVTGAEYERTVAIRKPQVSWKVRVFDFESLVVNHLQSDVDRQLGRAQTMEQWMDAPAEHRKELEEGLAWEYPDKVFTQQKTKLSVTEIKRIYETDYEPSDVVKRRQQKLEEYKPPVPEYLSGKQKMNAAQKGTWVHKTMELFDFTCEEDPAVVGKCLDDMREEGKIPEETKQFLPAQKVYACLTSDLGKRMKQASKNGLLYKEKQFVIGVPAGRILSGADRYQEQETDRDRLVVVQGIVDAYFEEPDGLVLVDYKTDRVKAGEESVLQQRYETQLRYYKETLEQLTGKRVKETYLYSFALDREIKMPDLM